jgi:hypothetical protein
MGIEFSLQSLLIIEFFALIFHNQERSGKKKKQTLAHANSFGTDCSLVGLTRNYREKNAGLFVCIRSSFDDTELNYLLYMSLFFQRNKKLCVDDALYKSEIEHHWLLRALF